MLILLKLSLFLIVSASQSRENHTISSQNDLMESIITGSTATEIQFPYQVSVQNFFALNAHVCGGTIITSKKILTAAHCTMLSGNFPFPAFVFRILAGSTRLDRVYGKRQVFRRVRRIIIHPKYNRKLFFCDLSILILQNKLNFNGPSIKPIQLAKDVPVAGTKCTITGWGNTIKERDVIKLQYGIVTIDDHKYCKEQLKSMVSITSAMVCAGANDVAGLFFGDSGGPLVCNNQLIGITSYTVHQKNRSMEMSDVFTSVPFMAKWIHGAN